MKKISVLKNFNEYPALRNCSISDFSGELFYYQKLNKAFKEAYEQGESLEVDLDGTGGYASSFLDEAFGSLVYDFTLDVVKHHIKIISTQEPHWIEMIENKTYIEWEKRRTEGIKPKVTAKHEPWFRLIENNLIQVVWEQV